MTSLIFRLHDQRVDSETVVAAAEPQLPVVIGEFHYDLSRLRMAHRIGERFAADPIELVIHERLQRPGLAYHPWPTGEARLVVRCLSVRSTASPL